MSPSESREVHGTSAFQIDKAVAGRCSDQNVAAMSEVPIPHTLPLAWEFGS